MVLLSRTYPPSLIQERKRVGEWRAKNHSPTPPITEPPTLLSVHRMTPMISLPPKLPKLPNSHARLEQSDNSRKGRLEVKNKMSIWSARLSTTDGAQTVLDSNTASGGCIINHPPTHGSLKVTWEAHTISSNYIRQPMVLTTVFRPVLSIWAAHRMYFQATIIRLCGVDLLI